MRLRARALTLLLGLCSACASEREAAEKQSAARIAFAVDALRDAPNAGKAVPLASLSKLACTGGDVCKTRDACVSAYTWHVEAVMLTAAARQKLADHDAVEAAKLLSASEQKLKEADARVNVCTDVEGALRRRYKL